MKYWLENGKSVLTSIEIWTSITITDKINQCGMLSNGSIKNIFIMNKYLRPVTTLYVETSLEAWWLV